MTDPNFTSLSSWVPRDVKTGFDALCKARGTTASKQVRAWVEYTVAEERQRVATTDETPSESESVGRKSAPEERQSSRARIAGSRAIPEGMTRARCFLNAEELRAVEADCAQLGMNRNDWLVRAVRSMLLKRPELTREEMILLARMGGEADRLNSHLDNVIPLPDPDTGEARMAVLDANLLEASHLVGRQIQDALSKVLSQARHRWLDP